MIRIGVKLLLIFVLVFAGVKIWYGRLAERLRPPAAVTKSAVKKPEVARTEIARQPDDYSVIVDRNIFKAVITVPEQTEKPPTPEDEAAKKLKLSLVGTISGTERDSRAIIADDLKKQQDIYQVGDNIQGALVKTIERGRVVIEVNGTDRELLLKEREAGGPAYEPPAGDVYQAPEPQVEPPAVPEVVAPQVEPPPTVQFEQQSAPEVVQPDTPPINPQFSEPMIRPRALHRPFLMPNASGGAVQPGNGMIMNVDKEKLQAKEGGATVSP